MEPSACIRRDSEKPAAVRSSAAISRSTVSRLAWGPPAAGPSGYFLPLHQAIAAAGYLVLLPNPRGSSGYGQQFTAACTGDWGGADYEDILACCEDLVERGVADRRR